MRASIGQILASLEGMDLLPGLIRDCARIAAFEVHPVQASSLATIRKMLAEPDSTLTSSMLRDIESNGKVEAEHIVGDMLVGGQLCEKRASNVSVTERTASIRKVWRGYSQAYTFRLRLGDAQKVNSAFLWCSVILWGIGLGAKIFDLLVLARAWGADAPASFVFYPYGKSWPTDPGFFFQPLIALILVAIVGALWSGWKTERSYRGCLQLSVGVFSLIWLATPTLFWPLIMRSTRSRIAE